MSHVQRYRSGSVSEIRGKIDAGDVVEVGDLVAQTGGYMKDVTLFAGTTETFHDNFAGVLVQGGTNGSETEDTDCLVYDRGEFEFPLSTPAAAAHPAGDTVGAVSAQVVEFSSALNEVIGKLAKPCLQGDTTVLVRIGSVVMQPVAVTPA